MIKEKVNNFLSRDISSDLFEFILHSKNYVAANVFMSNTLAGGDAFKEYGNAVDKKYLFQYQFPERKLLDESNIKAIWLQYYVRDWGWNHNGEFAIKHGLMGREYNIPEETGRYSKFGAVDSDMNIYNQMLKYYKFGF